MKHHMTYFWIILCIIFIIIEAVTPQLTTIWFALGSAASFVLTLTGKGYPIQLAAFVAVSVIFLLLTRPLARRLTKNGYVPTNADRLIGEDAVVTEEIDNLAASGTVKVGGQTWNARSENGDKIPTGETVRIAEISGAKLIVTKKPQ